MTYRGLLQIVVDRSIQLSNQFIKDFKEIADLTILLPTLEEDIAQKPANTMIDKLTTQNSKLTTVKSGGRQGAASPLAIP